MLVHAQRLSSEEFSLGELDARLFKFVSRRFTSDSDAQNLQFNLFKEAVASAYCAIKIGELSLSRRFSGHELNFYFHKFSYQVPVDLINFRDMLKLSDVIFDSKDVREILSVFDLHFPNCAWARHAVVHGAERTVYVGSKKRTDKTVPINLQQLTGDGFYFCGNEVETLHFKFDIERFESFWVAFKQFLGRVCA